MGDKMNIQSVGTSSILNNVSTPKTFDESNKETSFSEVISDAINKVNESQINADEKVEALIKGEDVSMHDVMLSMQESQISMQLLIEVRNKIVEAYEEINRVQL